MSCCSRGCIRQHYITVELCSRGCSRRRHQPDARYAWYHGYCTKGGATHELTPHFSTEGHDQPPYHAGPLQCRLTKRQEHSSRGCSNHCTVAAAIIIRLSWETSSDLSSSKINTVDTGGHDITHHEGVIRKIRSR